MPPQAGYTSADRIRATVNNYITRCHHSADTDIRDAEDCSAPYWCGFRFHWPYSALHKCSC